MLYSTGSRLATALLLALASSACGSNGSDPDPDPTPGASIALSPTSATVAAGASTTTTVTVTRTGGFTGDVTIGSSGAPAGVTGSGGTIAAGSNTQVVTLAAAAGAAAYSGSMNITATGAGITIAPASLALTVTTSAGGSSQIGDGIEGEAAYDEFGSAVALSANGTRVVVGSIGNDANGNRAGHARVFERSGDAWVQLGADLDGEATDDRFGSSVAIADNGGRIAVGSYLNDGGGTSSGHVRVFDYAGGAWAQVGADIDGEAGRGSGFAVAMSASGSRVVIGGPGSGSTTGHIRVYELAGGAWTQMGPTLSGNREHGHAVAMSDDGNRIAFGWPSAGGSTLPGSASVYDWNGTTWIQVGADIEGEGVSDNFGEAVALNGDGSVLAVGASGNDGGGAGGGHVRVFRLTSGTWTQVGTDIDGTSGGFGVSVSLSASGNRLMSTGAGGGPESIGIYDLTGGAWVKYTGIDFGTGGRMGAVALSADARTAAMGLAQFAGAAGAATGVVRLYGLP